MTESLGSRAAFLPTSTPILPLYRSAPPFLQCTFGTPSCMSQDSHGHRRSFAWNRRVSIVHFFARTPQPLLPLCVLPTTSSPLPAAQASGRPRPSIFTAV
eukprot:GGOE01047635.1.p5 GENE.GGOE01047635.1~~GGOE01047635.1.p5  ORF type:complete len:100 (+),score=3.04 GGOE01047635.1:29-328(+)